ncbi:helix-turn-helix transcriptional regulator [Paracidovorax konjaci]|uniref:Predicted DNA-binding transcriptional regulator AlpA n=1 Tax=Paracidovorax konjaci TaxID=32040 RepID=A0A1I1XQ31_9BURK|nr:AlpA family phage regulatory protein [Paracidovorax konjaci]SFE09371.1 Predicted DNA-binding transcriptional regulator AlpA [Paracidovorax konjaci]
MTIMALTLSKEQLLEELDIVENTLRALIDKRAFPHPRKIGPTKIRWLVAEVVEWLQAQPKAWTNLATDQAEEAGADSA